MRFLAILTAILLSSCASARMAKDIDENCVGPNSTCSVALAAHASLDILRANGDSFVVECETVDHPLDDSYRNKCGRELEDLAAHLSRSASGAISPVRLSDIAQKEFHACIETTSRDIDTYGIRATIPLRWLAK